MLWRANMTAPFGPLLFGHDFACCGDTQVQSISWVVGFTFVFLVMWSNKILSPLKHLAVYFHELSHAVAVALSCGKVKDIEVHYSSGEHGGGVTHHVGGVACCIVPAGYVGCGLWGLAMIVGSADELGSLVVIGLMCSFLALGLCFAGNGFLRCLLLGFLTLFAGFWAVQHYFQVRVMSRALLTIGTFISLDAVSNVWHDSHHEKGSDYERCARMTHCSASFCAALWALTSLCWLALAIFLNLYLNSPARGLPAHASMEDLDVGWEALSYGTRAGVAFPAIAFAVWVCWAVFKCRNRTHRDPLSYALIGR